jgi:hypothetical protein
MLNEIGNLDKGLQQDNKQKHIMYYLRFPELQFYNFWDTS